MHLSVTTVQVMVLAALFVASLVWLVSALLTRYHKDPQQIASNLKLIHFLFLHYAQSREVDFSLRPFLRSPRSSHDYYERKSHFLSMYKRFLRHTRLKHPFWSLEVLGELRSFRAVYEDFLDYLDHTEFNFRTSSEDLHNIGVWHREFEQFLERRPPSLELAFGAVSAIGSLIFFTNTAGAASSAVIIALSGMIALKGPPQVVYNAIPDPDGGQPDILLHHVPTRLSFYIGPPSTRNVIVRPDVSTRLVDAAERAGALDLTVTMICHVCVDTRPQIRSVRFSPDYRSSTVAVFDILPDLEVAKQRVDRAPAESQSDEESISFSIDHNGFEFDFVKAFVRIQLERTPEIQSPPRVAYCEPNAVDGQEPHNNLVLRVGRSNDAMTISFDAQDRELRTRLAKLGVDRLQNFRTGARSPETVTKLAGETYFHLKQLVEGNPSLRQQLPTVGELNPRAQYMFDAASEEKATGTLADLGVDMYDTLFYQGDTNLPAILETIERYGDEIKKLRILIYTNATYLPWQLLHAPPSNGEKPEVTQFWGNKYIIGIIPIGTERENCGRVPGMMTLDGRSPILYAHYWHSFKQANDIGPEGNNLTVETDAVSRLGEMFGRVVRQTLGEDVQIVRTKPEFKDKLTKDLRNLAILWTFTHGHSGDIIATIEGKSGKLEEPGGQRLSFSKSDSISAKEIRIATARKERGYFFASRPFVFLNGCETGTQGAGGTTDLSLPGVFLVRGARGVVATEAPIWDLFGYSFGALFLERLAAGDDAGEAMLASRLEFLEQSRNPLGLLYTYYGNPAVRIRKPGA